MMPESPSGRVTGEWWCPWRLRGSRLLIVLLFVACQVSPGPIADAVRMQQTWMSEVFNDAPPADTPAIAFEVAAPHCVSTDLPCPSPLGSLSPNLARGRRGAPCPVSRTRPPPLV